MAKMGRPLIEDEPKDVKLGLRLTKTQAGRIQNCADRMECNRVDVIMHGIDLVEEELKKEGK
ncbi:MAG: hypothetical protein J1G30_02005 [Spirochaetales bacterium]|nr:hypothetical protein [Spirochaetales bacterium]